MAAGVVEVGLVSAESAAFFSFFDLKTAFNLALRLLSASGAAMSGRVAVSVSGKATVRLV